MNRVLAFRLYSASAEQNRETWNADAKRRWNWTEFCNQHELIEITIITTIRTIELTRRRAYESETSSTNCRLITLSRLRSRSSESIDYRIVPLALQTRWDLLDIEPGIDIAWWAPENMIIQEKLTRAARRLYRSSHTIHHRYWNEQSDIMSSIKPRDFCSLASESLASACIP
jgi:hypothetical protein